MPSDGTLQTASNIIHYFASSNPPALKNLSTYHKHQTRLLSEIFSKIEKDRLQKLVGDTLFLHDILVAKRYIYRLERTLRGGALAVWYQTKESQDELARIQRLLAPHETSVLDKDKFNKRISEARAKDDVDMRAKIEELIKRFQSNGSRRRIMVFQRPKESYLDDLLPEVTKIQVDDEAYRTFAFKSLLGKFAATSLDPLSTLMAVVNQYIDAKLNSIQPERTFPPLDLQVIRKPSGSIVAILIGSKSHNDIQSTYCPEIEQMGKLPVLYTSQTHSDYGPSEFVVAQPAIQKRPDSRKYVVWNQGPAPSTDIYIVEKMGDDAFILATLLGREIDSDIVLTLPRDGYFWSYRNRR
ncbi:hypothetical protein B0H17DRAFT_1205080 [Mycena rosella]|uniref:Uncharacterized protein n=1 Tax=Mycena rosella TaxID=1033263 RepID=A0AAD7DBH0_MYCRO|nr:hypothetical protein B0H17DRAFT_1205080 [Mycena rosella]